MAIAVEDVARAALSSVGSNAGILQAVRWVSERYNQLANRGRLRALRKVAAVNIPAAITDGTASFTAGSDIVTGDSTAQAAWLAATSTANQDNLPATAVNTSIVGRYIRARRIWYKITRLEPDGSGGVQLRLETPFTELSAPNTAYKIVQRHTRMPQDMRFLGRFVQERLFRPMTQLSISELDLLHPERLFVTGTGPEVVAEIGDDIDGVRLVEFYPYPLRNETLKFTYYARPQELTVGMTLPDDISPEALKMGVLIDVYRYEMAQALRDNRVDVAATWRNEMRAQETTWERRIEELLRTDRSADDISLILHTQGPPAYGDLTFIRTARQDAISRIANWP
jgi:hypothetical protein